MSVPRLFQQAIAAVAERRSGSEALALRLALRIGMLAAQQNRETLDGLAALVAQNSQEGTWTHDMDVLPATGVE